MSQYGFTKSFGYKAYGVEGCRSLEEAHENVYRRAFEAGDWSPRPLRERWWQFWRPAEHTEIEKKFAKRP